MALTDKETALIHELRDKINRQKVLDRAARDRFDGTAKIKHLGIALPPEAEKFAFYPNWVRTYVKMIEERMDVRLLVREGTVDEDPDLRHVWAANHLDLHSHTFHTDLLVYGRAAVSVSRGSDGTPRVVVEDPRNLAVKANLITGETEAALRVYTDDADKTGVEQVETVVLYTPEDIIICKGDVFGIQDNVERIPHRLGRVPVVMAQLLMDSGDKNGQPVAKDLFDIVDLAGRTLMLLQLAMETVATPQKIAAGVTKEDFRNPDGSLNMDTWSRYYGSIWAISDTDAKVTQLPEASVTGFHSTMDMLVSQASAVTGLPPRLLGRSSANPASEGAIRAEESRLIKTVERVNTAAGAAWGWALGIAMRIISKTWEDGSVDVVWQNPATPTEAQQADRLQKLTGGKPVMSVRGAMEELPWSALRKQKEMEWLGEEADQELGYAAMDEPGDPYVTGADERGQYN